MLVALLMLAAYQVQAPALSSSSNTDCLYLLELMDIVLDYAIKGDTNGELMSHYLLESAVPTELRSLHVNAYRAVLNYYSILRGVEGSLSTSLPRLAQVNLEHIESYANRLAGCSRDREGARAILASINSKIRRLEEFAFQITKFHYVNQTGEGYYILQLKDLYLPYEAVELVVSKELQPGSVEVYTYPDHVKISDFKPAEINETHCKFTVDLPSAFTIEMLHSTIAQEVPLALYLRLVNGSYRPVALLKVQYGLPNIQLDFPRAIKYSEPLNITLVSDRLYNATLYFNNFKFAAMLLRPGMTHISLDYSSLNYTFGLNRVKLCVNATRETLSRCFDRPVYIEPLYPRVKVVAENVSIAWLGYAALLIRNEDAGDVRVTVIDLSPKTLFLAGGEMQEVEIYSGFLPIQVVNLRVVVEPTNEVYSTLEQSLSVIAINVPALILLTVASVLVVPSVAGHERSFTLAFTSALGKAQRASPSTKAPLKSGILKPHELGLNSRIAELYYTLLRKLKLRLPLLSETLREHYTATLGLTPEKLREKLWRLLLLVERDLYSSKKPAYKEAEGLYSGVLDATTEN